MSFGLLFTAACVASFIGALDGVGGGLILTPVLILMGVDIREAIALNAVSVVAISNSAAPIFLHRHLPNLKAGAVLEFSAIVGALIGAVLTGITSRHTLFLFGGSILVVSWVALWQKWKRKPVPLLLETPALCKESMLVGSYYDYDSGKTVTYEGKRFTAGVFCMGGVGLIAGGLGIGGGIFIVLVMDLVLGFPTKVALTMSNLLMGTIALASLGIYLEQGLIDSQWMIPVIFGVLLGAFLGAHTLLRIKGQVVRVVFLCVLALLALRMFHDGWVGVR